MAGERLFKLLNSKGGKDSDYADVVYGTVIEVNPLKVQIANNLVITEDFIELGRHIGKIKLQGKAVLKGTMDMTFHSNNDTANIKEREFAWILSNPIVFIKEGVTSLNVACSKTTVLF